MNRSFDILMAEYRPMILVYLKAMGLGEHIAEDLAQETFISAYESLDKFAKDGDFGKWVRGIARNKALMHWRASNQQPLVVDSRVLEGMEEVFEGFDRSAEDGDWWHA